MNGWVKTYRKIQEHWIWTSKEPYDMRSAWQYLIMNANYAENKILTHNGELLEIGRGQILVSVRNLSEKWKWSVSKVSKFLKRLEDDNMVQRIGNKSGTLLTIVNYSVYQGYENTKDTPNETQEEHIRYTEQHTEDTLNDTPKIQGAVQNKEDKEGKEEKKERMEEDTPPISPSQGDENTKDEKKKETAEEMFERVLADYNISDYLLEAVRDWIDYKKETFRFTYKEKGLKSLFGQVTSNARKYGDEAVYNAISNSIASGYQGIVFDRLGRNGNSQHSTSLVDEWRNA